MHEKQLCSLIRCCRWSSIPHPALVHASRSSSGRPLPVACWTPATSTAPARTRSSSVRLGRGVRSAGSADCVPTPTTTTSPIIAGKAIAGMPRHRVVLATKFGHVKSDKGRWVEGTREHIRRVVAKGGDAGCLLLDGWNPAQTMQLQGTQSMQILSDLLLKHSHHACSQSHSARPGRRATRHWRGCGQST